MTSKESIVKACCLIRVRSDQHYQVAAKIVSLSGVKSAFAVMGGADVVARIEVKDMSALAALGTQIGNLPDVVTTETFVTAEV
jgi:DNA-binding Lrp family transcriptional regulator